MTHDYLSLAERLAALPRGTLSTTHSELIDETDGALREAHAKLNASEPVAWVHLKAWNSGDFWPDDCFAQHPEEGMTPLYAAPSAEVERLKECQRLYIEGDNEEIERLKQGLTLQEDWSRRHMLRAEKAEDDVERLRALLMDIRYDPSAVDLGVDVCCRIDAELGEKHD